ncbi:hypothetical protein E2562_027805 [Oryza meyeriana var. granulata]|uniref:Uncharacterized protein n=1 Tax=Oryza meyeriana var. granulata TaxID=110450 RepID=A0A6G1DRD3_9ORYZ|nr:hypothetical protein E2562_027805 [Oryza meyeriana var. granulata]
MSASPRHKDTRRRWMVTARTSTNTIGTRRSRRRRWGTRVPTRTLRHSHTDMRSRRRRRCTRRRTRNRRRLHRTGTMAARRSARDASRRFVAAASWTRASDDAEETIEFADAILHHPCSVACSERI